MTLAAPSSDRSKFMALAAAFLGWLFDGFEMGLFPLIGKPALQDLLPNATPIVQGQWFTVIIAVFLVGAATGGVLFGWLGDKLGRVKAMALAIFTFAIFTGLCAFVTEAWQFAALRFIASLGMGGEWALGVALVNELWAGKNRAWIAGMIGAAANIGFLLTGILSLLLNGFIEQVGAMIHSTGLSEATANYLLHNRAWRFLAVIGALPALINFIILAFVPESHKWEQEKLGQDLALGDMGLLGVLLAAVAALVIIYAWSPMATFGLPVAIIITVVGLVVALWGYLHPVRQYLKRSIAANDSGSASQKMIMRHLLLGASLAGVALLGTWGSTQQAPKWASGLLPAGSTVPIIEYAIITSALGAIIIALITPVVADKLGRRLTYSLLCFMSLVIALSFFQMNKPFADGTVSNWFLISSFLLGGITASFYGFFPLYFPELFPTSVRATGQGFCFNFGRLIAAIGSLQLANLTGLFDAPGVTNIQASANAYSALSCVYVIGIFLVWICPETKGKALE